MVIETLLLGPPTPRDLTLRARPRRRATRRPSLQTRHRVEPVHGTAQAKPTKPQNAFEVGKQHLNALAAATRLLESLGLGQCASDIAGVLMQMARYVPHRRSGTTPHLDRADLAVALGGRIAKCIAGPPRRQV